MVPSPRPWDAFGPRRRPPVCSRCSPLPGAPGPVPSGGDGGGGGHEILPCWAGRSDPPFTPSPFGEGATPVSSRRGPQTRAPRGNGVVGYEAFPCGAVCVPQNRASHLSFSFLIPPPRRFGTKCAGCSQGISPSDLVRKARNKVFHLNCFTCMVCNKQLSTGEELYIIDENKFVCKEDYLNSPTLKEGSLNSGTRRVASGTPKGTHPAPVPTLVPGFFFLAPRAPRGAGLGWGPDAF